MHSTQSQGVTVQDENQEKDSFENDPRRALSSGADSAYEEKDTAAGTSDHDAAQAEEWLDAAPPEARDNVDLATRKPTKS